MKSAAHQRAQSSHQMWAPASPWAVQREGGGRPRDTGLDTGKHVEKLGGKQLRLAPLLRPSQARAGRSSRPGFAPLALELEAQLEAPELSPGSGPPPPRWRQGPGRVLWREEPCLTCREWGKPPQEEPSRPALVCSAMSPRPHVPSLVLGGGPSGAGAQGEVLGHCACSVGLAPPHFRPATGEALSTT